MRELEEKRRDQTGVAPRLHQLVLKDREDLVVEGVNNVESFDDQEVILETQAGVLMVRGRELHIKQLDLEHGNLAVEGLINGIEYTGEAGGRKGSKGMLGRIFR